jgi:hypothetical protein
MALITMSNNILMIASHTTQMLGLPKCLEVVHSYAMPFFVDDNIMQLPSEKLRHLETIKPNLQTFNEKPTK